MKEYAVFSSSKKTTLHIIGMPYTTYEEAKLYLDHIINFRYSKRKRKNFYIDCLFYNNIISKKDATEYYCIQEREVSEWRKYSIKVQNKMSLSLDLLELLKEGNGNLERVYSLLSNR